jgi:hypothetical protein
MISLMVHLAGGSLYGLFSRAVVKVLPQLASLQSPQLPKSDIIRLEKAQPEDRPAPAPPKPVHKPPPPPPPAPRVMPVPIVAPVERHHEIAHLTVHAPRQPAPSQGVGYVEQPHVAKPAAAPPEPKRPAYSQEQLDSLNGQFSQAIAQSHQSLSQANAAMASAPTVTTKHFQMSFNGIHEGMNPGDGIISVVGVPKRIGNIVYYYTHYEYMYGDGHVEEDDIPWVFQYAVRDDPFARGDRRIPIQPPPAGYKPNRPLKPILMQYFGGPQVN